MLVMEKQKTIKGSGKELLNSFINVSDFPDVVCKSLVQQGAVKHRKCPLTFVGKEVIKRFRPSDDLIRRQSKERENPKRAA